MANNVPQIHLAFFGGTFDPFEIRLKSSGYPILNPANTSNSTMDSAVRRAYFSAIGRLGGRVDGVQVPVVTTRTKWLAYLEEYVPDQYERQREKDKSEWWRLKPQEVKLAGEWFKIRHNASTSQLKQARDLKHAIDQAVRALRPGGVLAELVIFDHGINTSDWTLGPEEAPREEWHGQTLGSDRITVASLEPNSPHINEFLRLAPWATPDTLIVFAGCSVAANKYGVLICRRVSALLGIRTRGYKIDQGDWIAGSQGPVLECRTINGDTDCTGEPGPPEKLERVL